LKTFFSPSLANSRIRIRIRIKMKSRIPIRIRIKVMRIRNTGPDTYYGSTTRHVLGAAQAPVDQTPPGAAQVPVDLSSLSEAPSVTLLLPFRLFNRL